MNKKKILVSMKTYTVSKILHIFDKAKYELIFCKIPEDPTREQLKLKIKDVDAVLWNPLAGFKLDKELLDQADKLKVVSTISAGYDSIDIKELKARDIKLGYVSPALSTGVATHAVALLLAAARRLNEGREYILKGTWTSLNDEWFLGYDIEAKTIGIVGFGCIGQEIAKRLRSFEVGSILYSGHSLKKEGAALGAKFVLFNHLIEQSDFVIICCPLNEETKHLFNKETFQKMKSSAILVNIARGDVVDQTALIDALQSGQIAGAALDVMTPEPLPKDNPLTQIPNCVLTPHFGTSTKNTRIKMCTMAAENIINFFEGRKMVTQINL